MDNPKQHSFSLLCGIYCLLTVIILFFIALYYFHIERQKEQFSQYFLRQLSTTGSNVRESIEGLRTNIANTVKTNDRNKTEFNSVDEWKEKIKAQLTLISALDLGSLHWGETPPKELITEKKDVKVTFTLRHDINGYSLKAQVRIIDSSDGIIQNESDLFEINAGLEKLVIPLLPDDVFENFNACIVVAGKGTEVVLLETGSNLQLITLPKEYPKSDKKNDEKIGENDSRFLPVRDVEIGLNKYKLFLHPFRWHINEFTEQDKGEPAVKDEDIWLAGALIPKSTFLSKAMTISPTLGLVIFCVLCISLLILPFLRIRLIGRREVVKAYEVFVLTTGLLVGCSLVSLLAMNLLTRGTEINTIDSYLKRISGEIGERFSDEFSDLEDELIRRILEEEPVTNRRVDILSLEETEDGYPFFDLIVGMDEDGVQKWKWSIKETTTPMLELGQRKYFKYARDFELGQFNKVTRKGSRDGQDIFMDGRYIESIRSKNTGQSYAMLTLRKNEQIAKNVYNRNLEGTIVFAIQAMPLCLVDPVMPPGFGFALIDQDGTVQFHSSSTRNLRENFFHEATPRQNLEAFSKSAIPIYTDLEYRAKKIRAYITPFSGTPWTLIVFSDKSIPYRLGIETITFTAALYGAYLLVLVFVCLITLLFNPKHLPGEAHRMWLWPNVEQIHKYITLIIIMVVLWIIWGICIGYNTPPTILILMSFILPLLLLGTLFFMMRNTGRKSRNSNKRVYAKKLKFIYVIGALSLLISLAMLPPVGFYFGIYKEEAAVFIKYHQYELAKSIKRRTQKLKENYVRVDLSDSNREIIKQTLLHDPAPPEDETESLRDIYAVGFKVKIGRNLPEEPHPEFIQKTITVLRDLPLLRTSDKLSVTTRMFSSWKTDPEEFEPKTKWFYDQSKNIVMFEKNYQQPVNLNPSAKDFRVSSLDPMDIQIETEPYEIDIDSAGLILCVLILFPILFWLIGAFMKVIFIIDITHPVSPEGKNLVHDRDLKKQIRIRLQDRKPKESKSRYIITPNEIRESISVKPLLDLCRKSTKKEIILDRFENGLDDAPVALKKLELLEGLSSLENKQVIIRTSIDPLFLLTSRSQDPSLKENGEQDLLPRWAAVLQNFSKLRWTSAENEYQKLRNDFINNELTNIDSYDSLPEKVKQCLADEGWPNRLLWVYAKKLAGQSELRNYSAEDIVDQFRDLADAHYRNIWLSCSTDEKMLLYGLAQQGLVNWKMKKVLRSLMRRRIVFMAPNFRLMNDSFRQFILMAEDPQTVQEWEESAGIGLWARIKIPLILLGITLFAFYFITQREAFSQSLRIFSALAAGLPIIFTALGSLIQGRRIPME